MRYVEGERVPYLGRTYRLRLVDRQAVPLKLERGCFCLDRACASEGRAHLLAWYVHHGQRWIEGRIAEYSAQLGVAPSIVGVREMGRRWGTCTAKGKLSFHWEVALLPPEVIDYIVVHELAHLRELNHSRRFWALVEETLPDYRRHRTWLGAHGHEVTL